MKYFIAIIFYFITLPLFSQDTSLLQKLDDSILVNRQTTYIKGTFKTVYIINTQSVETPAKNNLLLFDNAPLWKNK